MRKVPTSCARLCPWPSFSWERPQPDSPRKIVGTEGSLTKSVDQGFYGIAKTLSLSSLFVLLFGDFSLFKGVVILKPETLPETAL